jgi:quercetin dioxygenase-like cupin family protein
MELISDKIRLHRLWRSNDSATAARALCVDFDPGAQWPGLDVHEPGPEEVYVVSGTFCGLTGPDSVHHAGTFLHFEPGTSHSPSSPTGGRLFVFYPRG